MIAFLNTKKYLYNWEIPSCSETTTITYRWFKKGILVFLYVNLSSISRFYCLCYSMGQWHQPIRLCLLPITQPYSLVCWAFEDQLNNRIRPTNEEMTILGGRLSAKNKNKKSKENIHTKFLLAFTRSGVTGHMMKTPASLTFLAWLISKGQRHQTIDVRAAPGGYY